ncbi:hypothetical protein D9M71_493550 [compost metagenome]
MVGTDQQNQWQADDDAHDQKRLHHRQGDAQRIHCRKIAEGPEGQPGVGRQIVEPLIDRTAARAGTIVLEHLSGRHGSRLLARADQLAQGGILDLVVGSASQPALQLSQQRRIDLLDQALAQPDAAIAPPLFAGGVTRAILQPRQGHITVCVIGPADPRCARMIRIVVTGRLKEIARADPGRIVTLRLIQLRAAGEQPRSGVAIAVTDEIGDFLQQHLTVNPFAVDFHAHLPDIRGAGDGGRGRRGHPFAHRMHQKPPDRYVGGALADGVESGTPGRFRRLGHTDTTALAGRSIQGH